MTAFVSISKTVVLECHYHTARELNVSAKMYCIVVCNIECGIDPNNAKTFDRGEKTKTTYLMHFISIDRKSLARKEIVIGIAYSNYWRVVASYHSPSDV